MTSRCEQPIPNEKGSSLGSNVGGVTAAFGLREVMHSRASHRDQPCPQGPVFVNERHNTAKLDMQWTTCIRPPLRPDGHHQANLRDTHMEAAPMQDSIAPAREEALTPPPSTSQPRKRRSGAVALGLLITLGLGLAGGMNVHRLVDLDQTATWLHQTGNALQSGLKLARREIASRIESFTSRPVSVAQASQEATSATPSNDAVFGRAVADLSLRVDQVRAANEGSARDLSLGIERIRSSAEQNQRELVAKLVQLTERVERVERQSAAVTVPGVTQPVSQPTTAAPAKPVDKP